jgi:hypothetical protein
VQEEETGATARGAEWLGVGVDRHNVSWRYCCSFGEGDEARRDAGFMVSRTRWLFDQVGHLDLEHAFVATSQA